MKTKLYTTHYTIYEGSKIITAFVSSMICENLLIALNRAEEKQRAACEYLVRTDHMNNGDVKLYFESPKGNAKTIVAVEEAYLI